jgi:hypothetical protein
VAERDRRLGASLVAFVGEMKRAGQPPTIDQARKRLELDMLQREAARSDDSISTTGARRALERVFTHMSFYAPRDFFGERRYAHAALALRVARLVKPTDAGACLWHARALAQIGDRDDALGALECAAASRQIDAAAIEADPLLATLRSDPRYEAAVRRLK